MLASATLFATTPPEVNQKVLKAFEETFKQPKDVVWHEYENFYEVDFKQGEIKTSCPVRQRWEYYGNYALLF